MWDFLFDLISALATIWRTDSEIRDQSPMTTGSQFDRDSRRFVARLCGGLIALLLFVGLIVWWFTRKGEWICA
jgi:hypothetical protein